MKRVDLNMNVLRWYTSMATPSKGAYTKTCNILNGFLPGFSLKELCQFKEKDIMYLCRDAGKRTFLSLSNCLSQNGLRFGMSKEEIDAYIAAYNSDNGISDKEDTPDKIDWEQRRWDVAVYWLSHDIDPEKAIEMADSFIGKYKNSLLKILHNERKD